MIQVDSNYIVDQGEWYKFEFCPKGSYATGFKIKYNENTGLNAVELFCDDKLSKNISSYKGLWGTWSKGYYCASEMRLVGFEVLVNQFNLWLNYKDEYTINGIKIYCEDRDPIKPATQGTKGQWSEPTFCKTNGFICGISVQYKYVLNNIKFACCLDIKP